LLFDYWFENLICFLFRLGTKNWCSRILLSWSCVKLWTTRVPCKMAWRWWQAYLHWIW